MGLVHGKKRIKIFRFIPPDGQDNERFWRNVILLK